MTGLNLTTEQIELLKTIVSNTNIDTVEEHIDIETEPDVVGMYTFEDNNDMSFSLLMNRLNDSKIRSKQTYASMARGCIAIVNCDGSYLIKELNSKYNMITYKSVTTKELKSMIEFNVKLCYTDAEHKKMNDKQRANKKKITTSKIYEMDVAKLITRDTNFRSNLHQYDSVHLVQVNDKCFSLRRPPVRGLYLDKMIKYKPDIAKEFIEFVASRIRNPEAWIDLINTIKYQMVNPNKKACRFYLNYEANGGSGKSFSSAGIAKMFNQFAMINVSPSTMKDTFNSWINGKLFVSFEEAESDNYVDKEVNTFVKRWTSIDISSRAMYSTTTTGSNYAIATMTANDPGLYGLARCDAATKRRLVIAMFKPNDLTSKEWEAKSDMINDVSFGYSLHKYINDSWTITEDYDPTRYHSSIEVWTELQGLKKNCCETFNALLRLKTDDYKSYPVNYNIVEYYNGARVSYYYVDYTVMMESFKKHLQLNNNKQMAVEAFKTNMTDLGWNYCNAKKMYGKQCAVFFRDNFAIVDDDSDIDNDPVYEQLKRDESEYLN